MPARRRPADEFLRESHRIPEATTAFTDDKREKIAALADLVVEPSTGLGPGDHHRH
jgi:hypothetical protein